VQIPPTKVHLSEIEFVALFTINFCAVIETLESKLKQLLKYDHANRTKSDEVIALMMSLLPIFTEMHYPKKAETQLENWRTCGHFAVIQQL
jgi:hypothetical protein